MVTEPEIAIESRQFYGKYICARRGGKPFYTEDIRLDPENFTCSEKRCSQTTSNDNTVCYPEEDHATSCPITDIKILPTQDQKSLPLHYQVHNFTDSLLLAFSRDFDGMPLVNATLQFLPCMKADEFKSRDPKMTTFYPTELDRKDGCKPFKTTGDLHDDYYRATGLKISLLQM